MAYEGLPTQPLVRARTLHRRCVRATEAAGREHGTRWVKIEFIDMLGGGGAGVEAEIALGGQTGAPLWWAARAVRTPVCDCTCCKGGRFCGPARAVLAGGAGAGQLATLLIEKGADVDAVGADADGNDSTPLWWGGTCGRERSCVPPIPGRARTRARASHEGRGLWETIRRVPRERQRHYPAVVRCRWGTPEPRAG